ncbi:MAG TPA: T9SS type A sorting domain-containing protein [Rhodothermales bacterium]|nr:T9SS type A sorting domain-containing protein [Rhodothermales bacterium]
MSTASSSLSFNAVRLVAPAVIACLGVATIARAQQWVSTEGPFSGEVTAVAATPEGTVIAGTAGKGLFYRSASDHIWSRSVADTFDGITIHSIVNFGEQLVASTAGRGVYRSVDGGENWAGLNTGLGSLIVRALLVASDGRLYAGGSNGLYRLSGPANWTALSGGIEGHDIRAIAENSEGVIYAGSFGRGIMRSMDTGLSWDLLADGLATTITRSLAINSNDEVFVGTFGGDVVQRSDDGGSTWVASNEGLVTTSIWAISVAPDGTFFVGSQRDGIFRSTDGRTWEQTPAPVTTVSGFTFSGGRVFAATRVGLLASSTSGQEWTLEGIPFSRVNTLLESDGRLLAGLELGGIHYSDDQGYTWHPSHMNNEDILRLAEDQEGNLLAATVGAGVLRSTDAGITWQQIWDTQRVVYSITADTTGGIIASTDSGVYRLAHDDTTFRLISPPGVTMRSVLVTSGGTILAGSEFQSIWRSDNEGAEWSQVAHALIGDLWIWDLSAMPDGRIAAATTGLGAWLSADDGLTWAPLPGTGDVVMSDLSLSPNGDLIGVGFFGQVFVIPRNSDHADAFGPPFLSTPVVRSVAALTDGTVLIGTDPLGVRRLDGLRIVSTESSPEIPVADKLDLYPNPTDRVSGIQVRFGHAGPVRWEIIDILGRRLAFGEHVGATGDPVSFQVDISDLSPGVYWIRVRGEDFDRVGSVVVR